VELAGIDGVRLGPGHLRGGGATRVLPPLVEAVVVAARVVVGAHVVRVHLRGVGALQVQRRGGADEVGAVHATHLVREATHLAHGALGLAVARLPERPRHLVHDGLAEAVSPRGNGLEEEGTLGPGIRARLQLAMGALPGTRQQRARGVVLRLRHGHQGPRGLLRLTLAEDAFLPGGGRRARVGHALDERLAKLRRQPLSGALALLG
jgi:hypothetical protein